MMAGAISTTAAMLRGLCTIEVAAEKPPRLWPMRMYLGGELSRGVSSASESKSVLMVSRISLAKYDLTCGLTRLRWVELEEPGELTDYSFSAVAKSASKVLD